MGIGKIHLPAYRYFPSPPHLFLSRHFPVPEVLSVHRSHLFFRTAINPDRISLHFLSPIPLSDIQPVSLHIHNLKWGFFHPGNAFGHFRRNFFSSTMEYSSIFPPASSFSMTWQPPRKISIQITPVTRHFILIIIHKLFHFFVSLLSYYLPCIFMPRIV